MFSVVIFLHDKDHAQIHMIYVHCIYVSFRVFERGHLPTDIQMLWKVDSKPTILTALGPEHKFKRLSHRKAISINKKLNKKKKEQNLSKIHPLIHDTRSETFLLMEHFGSSAHQLKQLHCGQAPAGRRRHRQMSSCNFEPSTLTVCSCYGAMSLHVSILQLKIRRR